MFLKWRSMQSLIGATALAVLCSVIPAHYTAPSVAEAQTQTPSFYFGADFRAPVHWGSGNPYDNTYLTAKATGANLNMVRYSAMLWSNIETSKGVFNETEISKHVSNIQALLAKNIEPVVLVHSTPAWARPSHPSQACFGPDNVSDFQNFMYNLVTKVNTQLGSSARHVKYWQIWNEQDSDLPTGSGASQIEGGLGCFGQSGGATYGRLLAAASTGIKQADSSAKVVFGGLAGNPSTFLNDALSNGAAGKVDVIDFHNYAYSSANLRIDWSSGYSTFQKVASIRSVLNLHNMSSTPIILGETGLICYISANQLCSSMTNDVQFLEDQSNYAVRTYTRAFASGLMGVQWYSLALTQGDQGNLNYPLIDYNYRDRPAYKAVGILAGKLGGATFCGDLSVRSSSYVSEYEGYKFCKGSTEYQIYWTRGSDTASLPKITNVTGIYDAISGNAISTSTISFKPIIVERNIASMIKDIAVPGDYNGNGKSDYAVWRPSDATWYIRYDDGTTATVHWGASTDIPVPADFNGDGKTDYAVWRPIEGKWYVSYTTGGSASYQLGAATDKPIAADYDGDGKADYAVWTPWEDSRKTSTPPESLFDVFSSKSQQRLATIHWGSMTYGDVPVVGDYDGDGKADYAVWRPTDGNWYVKYATGATSTVLWGTAGDIPVAADYDGDNKTDYAVWRPSDNKWYVKYATGGTATFAWGTAGDIPVAADYDNDNKADYAVWRPADGKWYVKQSSNGLISTVAWGTVGE